MSTMANWPQMITQLQQATGWSLERIAQEAGVSLGYVSRLKSGKQDNPGAAVIERLARGLGVSVAALDGEVPLRIGARPEQAEPSDAREPLPEARIPPPCGASTEELEAAMGKIREGMRRVAEGFAELRNILMADGR